jgi:peptide/nickel transport system substrate-binding protein
MGRKRPQAGGRHRLRFPAALLCLCLTTSAAFAADPPRGGSAIFVLSQDPATANPSVSSNVPDRILGCIIYQGLIEVTLDYKIIPLLAKSWTISPDGLTYTFDLISARWQDGQAFTGDDVKYSLLDVDAKYSAIFAPAGRVIDTIDTPAPDQVVIKLKQPFGPFLLSLGCIQGGAILPAHLFRGTDILRNPATTDRPVGTGAFKVTEWQHGDHIRLERNPDYAAPGKPYLDEIIGKVIPQSTSRTQALQSGEVDLIYSPPGSDLAAIRADPKLKLVTADTPPLSSILFFNTVRKPFGDKRVRQALFMATDRDYILKTAFQGVGSVGRMPFTTDIPWAANTDIDYRTMYPFDPKRANTLLDEAGAIRGPDGKRFAAHIAVFATQYPEFQQVALAMKSMWQAVGVDLVIDALEDQTYLKRIYLDRDFDLSLVTYTSYSDPALGIARTFVTASIGRPYGNAAQYSNPDVDKLFLQGETATSLDDRGKFYRKAQAILALDLPVLQLRQYKDTVGASRKLNGLWGEVQGNGNWPNAWMDK